MTVYCTRTGAPKPNQNAGAAGFWPEWRVCPQCGRGSFLLDECPDCGATLHRRASAWRLGLNLLLPLVGYALCAAVTLRFHRELESAARWVNIAVSVVLVVVMVLLLLLTLWLLAEIWQSRDLMSVVAVWQLPWTEKELQAGPEELPVVQQAKMAYYADLAWLEQAVSGVASGDAAARDRLFGRAVWLSQICDCPRLAFLRFRLLCLAPLQEGDPTDHAAILRQTVGYSETMAEQMLWVKNGWKTICDCLCMDPQGPCEEWGALLCARMLVRACDVTGPLEKLSESDRRRIVDTAVFCGAEGLQGHWDDAIVQQLLRCRYYPELMRRAPAFEPLVLR